METVTVVEGGTEIFGWLEVVELGMLLEIDPPLVFEIGGLTVFAWEVLVLLILPVLTFERVALWVLVVLDLPLFLEEEVLFWDIATLFRWDELFVLEEALSLFE